MGKILTNIVVIGLMAVVAVWLWPTGAPERTDLGVNTAQSENTNNINKATDRDPNTGHSLSGSLVSKITPSKDGMGATDDGVQRWANYDNAALSVLSEHDSVDLQRRFEQANAQLLNGQWQAAEQGYKALIQTFPNFVEPYVNLAAAQAKDGRLEDARQSLMQGASANPSTAILFESINQLHGALAAQAYRSALETRVNSTIVTSLPKVNRLATDFEQAQQLERLSQQLADAKNQQATLSANSAQLDDLKTKFNKANQKVVALEFEHQTALEAMQKELALEQEKRRVAAAKLDELRSQSGKVEGDLVAKLRIELKNAETALQASQRRESDLVVSNNDLSRQLTLTETSLTAAPPSMTRQPANDTTTDQTPLAAQIVSEASATQRKQAIGLVKAWAQAWSAQDVEAYVGFYQGNYSSGSNLSHNDWVAQRRVRLTNKNFIQVKVRDFAVKATHDGFTVTFAQHYRSNTLDDTIIKRLSFTLPDNASASLGRDWSAAKINGERIIRR